MTHSKISISFSALLLVILLACSAEETDTQLPMIEVISPTPLQEYHPGDIIHFEANFSDNISLSQFKIDIHFGEGHDHKSVSSPAQEVEWSYETIGELSGQSQNVQMDILIPENAKPGKYDLLVFCTDTAGNESWELIEFDIEGESDH